MTETTPHITDAEFVQDTNAGVALVRVTAEDFNNFIDTTRDEVQSCIEYSAQLGALILSEDNATEGGVSMLHVIELLDEIESELKEEPTGLLRFHRALTVTAATLNMPIPPKMRVIDAVSQTALSMISTAANLSKREELAKRIKEAREAHPDVEERRGAPETTPAEGQGSEFVDGATTALVDAVDKLVG